MQYKWADTFRQVYSRALRRYRSGLRKAKRLFTSSEIGFLQSIGCKPQELFDLIQDYCDDREPSWETVLLITDVRRRYFSAVQKGRVSSRVSSRALMPSKEAQLGGITWLPRIIAKARAKLRGQMPEDLMYCCGGDRPFLRRVGIHPADFLLLVWEAGDDDQRILDEIRGRLD